MDKRESTAVIYALGAVLLWSTVATAFKLGLAELSPAQLLLGACLVSTVLFAAIVAAQRLFKVSSGSAPAEHVGVSGQLVWQACALGLLNPLLYYLVLFEAYARLPAQLAQPLNYTWAITLAVLAVPVLGQSLTPRNIGGILVSYVGVVILLTGASLERTLHWDTVGVLLAIASTFLWAGYWLASTRNRLAGPNLLLIGFAAATPPLALYCWLTDGLPPVNQHTVVYSLWVGLVEMGLAFLLWQQALRHTRQAARLGQLIFLSPFISLVLISEVLNEPIAATSVAGLAVIVAGIILARQPAS